MDSPQAEAIGKCDRKGKGFKDRMQTIDKALSTRNLTEACSEVVKNKGAGGIDGMSVAQLKSYLDVHRKELCSLIHEGKYIPQPIRGKEIPKRNGKIRLLGIPTVIDRMLQQAVLRVIMPQFEYMFSDYSFGFRPQRGKVEPQCMKRDAKPQLASRAVDFPAGGFIDGAVLVAISASDAFVESALPLFQYL